MMKKALIPSVILVLLGIIVVLVIRNEGEKTRAAMREAARDVAKEQMQNVHKTVQDGFKTGVGDLIDDARNRPTEVPGKMLDVLGGFFPGSKDKPATDDEPAKGDKKKEAAPRERVRPQELLANVFARARDAAKATDEAAQSLLALDTRDEIELGREVREEFAGHFKFAELPDQLDRIQRLAAPILERRTRKEIEYTFAIVDAADLNAFSILGGSIYIHTGLLDRMPSDAELQGVIAHEIGHVDLKHCVRKFTYAARLGEVGGDPAQALTLVAYRILSVAYSEDHEFEADEFAFRTQIKAGHTRDHSLAFTKFLLKAEDHADEPRPPRRSKNVFETVGREVSNHYRTHPSALERLRRLEQLKVE